MGKQMSIQNREGVRCLTLDYPEPLVNFREMRAAPALLCRNSVMAIGAIQMGILTTLLRTGLFTCVVAIGAGGALADGRIGSDHQGPGASAAYCKNSANASPKPDRQDSVPMSLQEEIGCAADWLRDDGEFEYEIGLVPIGDQIIWNGRKIDMVALYKRPAQSNFDFRRCSGYGYERPGNLMQFSVNRWTAVNSLCKLLDPAVIAQVRELNPTFRLRKADRAECERFQRDFATPESLEGELRKTHHPIP